MPTSAQTALGFFGQFADVGIRAPEQNGLLQQALTNGGLRTVRPTVQPSKFQRELRQKRMRSGIVEPELARTCSKGEHVPGRLASGQKLVAKTDAHPNVALVTKP